MNYEAFRLRQHSAFQTTILTADARNGIFTYKDTAGNVQKANVLNLTEFCINPAITSILGQVPTADNINTFNSGDSSAALLRNTAGYSFLARNNRTRDNVTGTTDYVISSRQSLSGSFSWNRDLLDRPSQQNDYSLVPKVTNDNVTKFTSASWRFTPTATLTNELRGGFKLAPGIFATQRRLSAGDCEWFRLQQPDQHLPGPGTQHQHLQPERQCYLGSGQAFCEVWLLLPIHPHGTIQRCRYHADLYHRSRHRPLRASLPASLPGISASDLTAANNLLASLTGAITSSSQTFNVNSETSGFVNGATSLRHFQYDNYAFYIQDNWRVRRT